MAKYTQCSSLNLCTSRGDSSSVCHSSSTPLRSSWEWSWVIFSCQYQTEVDLKLRMHFFDTLSLRAGCPGEFLPQTVYFHHFQCIRTHLLFWPSTKLPNTDFQSSLNSEIPHATTQSLDLTQRRWQQTKGRAGKVPGLCSQQPTLWIKRTTELLPKVELYHQCKRKTKLSLRYKYSSCLKTSPPPFKIMVLSIISTLETYFLLLIFLIILHKTQRIYKERCQKEIMIFSVLFCTYLLWG